MEFAKGMHELHKKVNSSEVIVGWWATGREVKSQSTPIHEYYALQCSNPIHLVVDTSLTRDRMDIEAFARYFSCSGFEILLPQIDFILFQDYIGALGFSDCFCR